MTTDHISRLATGFFAWRDADADKALVLLRGRLKLGDQVLDVQDPRTYDDPEALPRHLRLELHSLRWLDVLRRSRRSVSGADQAWSRIFDAWSRSDSAADKDSIAWAVNPLEQRSVAIALGAPDGSAALASITDHLEQLARADAQAVSALRRLHLMRVRLALQTRRGDPAEAMQQSAVEAATAVFRESGYAVAEDLQRLVAVAHMWEHDLLELGVPTDHDVMDRLRGLDFWVQAMAPDGTLVPMGGEVPDPVPGAATARMRYVLTGGEEGLPPADIRHVDPEGLVSLRSGWGETERDVQDETHVTMILGPVRGREAHHDPSRITYHSQGRPWLIDPMADEAAGNDAHSIIAVQDVRYRLHGGAELVRRYSDERVDGFVVKNSLYLRVQWQRHAVFARTGNYLVIDDLLRSSTPYEAHLQWIVAPDVEIEPAAQGFLLHDDKRTVSIVVSTSGLRGYTIDELTDAAGERIAWRIRVPMIGTSNRAVTIISDVVDRQRFKARRVARPGKEFTVDITDKHIDETLVVTPELSAIVPAGLDPEDAVSRTIELAAAGSLSEDEALEQRLQVRRAIQHVKSRIRAEGAGPEARLRGIEQLQDAGRELKVAGLRDHGFASALIDIAGTDLADRIAANPSVGNVRRSPLVRWGDETLIQEGYSVPVHTTLDAGTFPAEAHEPSVWSVDLGQLVISSYLVDEPGDVLTVYFHGATDRTRFSMPRYERLRSMPLLGTGPVMFFSDPCLDLDSRMILSWYVGTEDLDLHREIARMIEAYARKKEIDKVLLVGNSGGGFAALQLGAILQGTRVVSFNPQVQIDRYVPRIAQTAHWSLFGRDTVSDDPVHAPRMDLIESYRRIGFDQDVVLIQNPGDDLHYKEHFLPFTEAFRASGNADRLRALTPYLGPGHRVPPPNEYLDYVRHAVDGAFGNWSLEGIRTTGDSPEARDLDDNRLRTDEIVTRA